MGNLKSFLSPFYLLFQLLSTDKFRCPLLNRSRAEGDLLWALHWGTFSFSYLGTPWENVDQNHCMGMVDPSHKEFTACSLDETAAGLLGLICITGGENHDFLTGLYCLYVHVYSFITVSLIFGLIKGYSRVPTKQWDILFLQIWQAWGRLYWSIQNACPVWFGSCKCRGLYGRDVADVRQEVLGLGEKSA